MLNKFPASDSFFFPCNKYIKYIRKVTENYIISRQIDPQKIRRKEGLIVK